MADPPAARTMRRRLRTKGLTVLLAMGLIQFSPTASSTGGGTLNIGSPFSGAVDDTAARVWVELAGKGGLLTGWPDHKLIKLITVYAPGCESGHLILRELKLPEGGRSLLLSAPASLLNKTRRATIYMKHASQDPVLLEYVGSSWERRKPQALSVAAAEDSHGASQDILLAFPVEGLGSYQLLGNNAPDPSISIVISKEASARSSDSIYRGVLPWAWSVLLLAVGWAISRWIHKTERHVGK